MHNLLETGTPFSLPEFHTFDDFHMDNDKNAPALLVGERDIPSRDTIFIDKNNPETDRDFDDEE